MVKITYSDALGDSHTFIKNNEKEAIDWLEKGKYPHGAIFNVKIDGKLYKKQMRDSKTVYDKAIKMLDSYYRGFEIKMLPNDGHTRRNSFGAYKGKELITTGDTEKEVRDDIDDLLDNK